MNLDKAELLFFLWASEWSVRLGSIKSGVAFTPPLSSLVQAIPTVRERRAHSVASRNMSWNQLSVFELSNQSITKSLPCLALTALRGAQMMNQAEKTLPYQIPACLVLGCYLPPGTPAIYLQGVPSVYLQGHLLFTSTEHQCTWHNSTYREAPVNSASVRLSTVALLWL